jgi:hypothetical protein
VCNGTPARGLPPGQRFTILVDNQPVGVFTTDDRGGVDLEIQEGESLAGW